MARAASAKSKKEKAAVSQGKLIALRVLARLCLVLAVVGVFLGGRAVLRKWFFLSNPRFTVSDVRIDVLSGTVEPDVIAKSLPVKVGATNLFEVDLHEVRTKVLAYPMVQQVEVRRILPGILWIRIFGRMPVARLLGGNGRLVDEDGLILPPVAKDREETAHLPIITGIPDVNAYQIGDVLDNELARAALEFLRLKATARHGNWLDVQMVQLGHRYRELRVYLSAKDVCLLKENTVLIIPAKDVEGALDRVLRVIEERARANQPTSQIDATSLKVIVLP